MKRADRPSDIHSKSRPFINISPFAALDTDSMPFEKLVDFIQCNGITAFRWPRKLKEKRKRNRQKTKASNQPGNDQSNPIILSPTPRRSLRLALLRRNASTSAQSLPETQLAGREKCPLARSIWDDIPRWPASPLEEGWRTPFAEVLVPTLSFVCRSGWDLNKKETWVPAPGFKVDDSPTPDEAAEPQPLEPVFLGTVSFTRASEKDTEEFMSRFLSCEGAPTVDLEEIQE